MIRKSIVPALALAVAAVTITGCPKKPVDSGPASTPATRPAEPAQPSTPPQTEVTDSFKTPPVESAPVSDASIDQLNSQKPLQTVHFEYDSSDLDDTNRSILQQNAEWLKKNPKRTIRIEGHTDERGTIKYNLALGERRANSVREYLESLGVASSRMRIVSFGEEKPATSGHDEGSWRENRRAEFWFES
jgi:peptidoglycan-associated lipoprotein